MKTKIVQLSPLRTSFDNPTSLSASISFTNCAVALSVSATPLVAGTSEAAFSQEGHRTCRRKSIVDNIINAVADQPKPPDTC